MIKNGVNSWASNSSLLGRIYKLKGDQKQFWTKLHLNKFIKEIKENEFFKEGDCTYQNATTPNEWGWAIKQMHPKNCLGRYDDDIPHWYAQYVSRESILGKIQPQNTILEEWDVNEYIYKSLLPLFFFQQVGLKEMELLVILADISKRKDVITQNGFFQTVRTMELSHLTKKQNDLNTTMENLNRLGLVRKGDKPCRPGGSRGKYSPIVPHWIKDHAPFFWNTPMLIWGCSFLLDIAKSREEQNTTRLEGGI